jgi:hypothetical protein
LKKFLNLGALKRLAAILLLGILCFNWCGYRLLTSYLSDCADRDLEARLDDNNYDESQLISIKVPSTHLTYYNSSDKFERVDGRIEIGGVQYKYVKRRLFNDSVEVLCIPNQTGMNIQTAKNDFYKLVNDLQHNGQGKNTGSHSGNAKSPFSECYTTIDHFIMHSLHVTGLPKVSAYELAAALSSSHSSPAEQPPDQLSAHC